MPSLELFVDPLAVRGLTADGNLPLVPPLPGLDRVLLRRLSALLRVPPVPGAYRAVIDPGAPLSVFPHALWSARFGWRAGRDYDELSVAGVGPVLRGQVLGYRYNFRLARLRVPVEVAGRVLGGPRLRLDALVTQLAEPGGPPDILLGLWGGVLDDRKLAFHRRPNGDELEVALEF